MDEVSNKTLAILAVIAIAVGIIGILVSGPKITGQAGTTQTGTTQLNITNVVSITLTTDTVDFGSGYVNASADLCYMDTTGTYLASDSASGCVGFNDISNGGFILENDGNVNVSVTANSTVAATFIGGTSPAYMFASGDGTFTEEGSCISGDVTEYVSFTGSPQTVCSNLRYEDSNDELTIAIYVDIPDDADVGTKSTNVVFTATEV